MSGIVMAKDRKAIARVRHDYDFLSSRKGMLAVTIDLDDAKRILDLIDRFEAKNEEIVDNLERFKKWLDKGAKGAPPTYRVKA